MAVHTVRRKLTYEDYALIPEDGQGHEIIDGKHYVSPTPYVQHQQISVELCTQLYLFIEEHRLGELLAAPIDVLLSQHDILQPDIIFISNDRASILTEANIQGAPDLVIEILSPITRRLDERLKLERYELLGVREFWIVDPAGRVDVFQADGEAFRRTAELSSEAEDVLTTPILPGLQIPLADLFR